MCGGRFGGCLQSEFFDVILWRGRSHGRYTGQQPFCFGWLRIGSAGTAEEVVSDWALAGRASRLVRRDGDGVRGGEEEARIRQDAPSITEKDNRATVLGSNAAGPSP